MVKSVLVVVLVVLALVSLALLSWLLVLYLEWPLWGALAIFLGVLAVYFGLKTLRRFWVISRAKSKLLATERRVQTAAQEGPDFQAVLLQKWRSAVDKLKGSQLRRFGNPLYVLPWYMVMGESGSGKTTAITRSRLSPMLRDSQQTREIVQTTNCDWWFFSEAIVLDTAGRYVSPDSATQDQQEWDYLLELFGKYRAREGLNGLVVVIDAPSLLAQDAVLIEQRGQSLRERLDQLMRLFEKRLPIYIMVTKCDQVYGFAEWAQQLTETQSQEAMGFLADQSLQVADEQKFAQEAIEALSTRLEKIRLDASVRGTALSPEMLLLPGELLRLVPGLQLFLKSALGNNPYLEHPLLRGLFLTSARQQPPQPSRLGTLLPPAPTSTENSKGLFIHDIFSRILPKERHVALPGLIVGRWRRVTARLGVLSWLLLFAAALIFTWVSYLSTSGAITRLGRAIPPGYGSPVQTDAKSEMDDLSAGLVMIEMILAQEKDWRTRWLAFNPEIDWLEESLKQEFVKRFRTIQNSDSGVNLNLEALLKSEDVSARAYALLGLARYINLVQARIDGAGYDQILAMPQLPPQLLQALEPRLDRKLVVGVNSLMSAAIAWSKPNDPYLLVNLKRNREVLRQEVFRSGELQWLVDWANALTDVSPVTLDEFWLNNPGGAGQVEIHRGLTLAGKARIDGFLSELKQALPQETNLSSMVGRFESWFREQRLYEWHSLAWGFMNGERLLGTEPTYRDTVVSLDKPSSPFDRFFVRLIDEFRDISDENAPSWLNLARYQFNLHQQVQRQRLGFMKPAADLITAVNYSAGKALRESFDQKTNLLPEAVARARQDMALLARYHEQRAASLKPVLASETQALNLVTEFLGGGGLPAVAAQEPAAPSPLAQMQSTFQDLRANSRFKAFDDEAIWRLIEGPQKLIASYSLEQASCKLQEEWDKGVMWKTRMAISPQEASNQLFDNQGSVWAFLDGPAKNLVSRPGGVFGAAQRDGLQFPFAPGFMSFLNEAVSMRVDEVVRQKRAEASAGKTARLTLGAQPIGVNPGAKVRPYAASLTLQCANEAIELSNMNMQASKTFVWSPQQCGEVTLQLKLDRISLTRRYPGPLGLANFLAEFSDGARVFTPADFPSMAPRLEALGVREITLRYDMTGQDQVQALARDHEFVMEQASPSSRPAISRLQIQVPPRAGRCWTSSWTTQEPLSVPRLIQQEAEKQVRKSNPGQSLKSGGKRSMTE